MSNIHYMKAFKRKEYCLRIAFSIYFIIIIMWWWIVWVKQYIDFRKPINNWFNVMNNLVQILTLSYSYTTISKNMQMYHSLEYAQIKKNLRYFYLVSFCNLVLNFIIALTIYYFSNYT